MVHSWANVTKRYCRISASLVGPLPDSIKRAKCPLGSSHRSHGDHANRPPSRAYKHDFAPRTSDRPRLMYVPAGIDGSQ
jgi:hypothetical protein